MASGLASGSAAAMARMRLDLLVAMAMSVISGVLSTPDYHCEQNRNKPQGIVGCGPSAHNPSAGRPEPQDYAEDQ